MVLNRLNPGWTGGVATIRIRSDIEDQLLALSARLSTPLSEIRAMPLWQCIRYIKKLTAQNG